MLSDAALAKSNLHSARAALYTARQRLSDAEDRLALALSCGTAFASSAAANSDLGWWRAQVEQAERAVAQCEIEVEAERVQ